MDPASLVSGSRLSAQLRNGPQSALEEAHTYAARSERHEQEASFERAAELARKASEGYARAVEENTVSDPNVKPTLLKLQEEWARRAKDLQRRADAASKQGSRAASLSRRGSQSQGQDLASSRGGLHSRGASAAEQDERGGRMGKRRASGGSGVESGPGAGGGSGAHPDRPQTIMDESPLESVVTPPGESFMMLASSDPSDPFNQFWTILQGMLENLSGPVAWATAPLNGELPAPPAAASNPEEGASVSSVTSVPATTGGVAKTSGGKSPTKGWESLTAKANGTLAKGKRTMTAPVRDSDSEGFSSDLDDTEWERVAESPLPSPSRSRPAPASRRSQLSALTGFSPSSRSGHSYPPRAGKTLEELGLENKQLKENLDAVSRQLEAAKRELAQRREAERENVGILRRFDQRQRMLMSMSGSPGGSPRMGLGELLRPSEGGAQSPRMKMGGLGRAEVAGTAKPGASAEVAEKEKQVKEQQEREQQLKAKEQEAAEKERAAIRKKQEEEMEALRGKLKEKEEEATRLGIENEKNKVDLKKYRDRWEKVKETAKKKKEAKSLASASAEGSAAVPVNHNPTDSPDAAGNVHVGIETN